MRLALAVLATILVGCGGPSGSGAVVGADPDAGAPITPPDGDGGSPLPDGGGNDGGVVKDGRIDPIEVGHSWTYDVTVLGIYPLCQNGTFTSRTLETSMLDGKTALHVESLCPGVGVVKYAVDGDRVHSYFLDEWILSLDAPVQAGHQWTDGYRDYRWESKGTVTVPAGTFSDCWSATTIAAFESYILLCRGVGPVRWHYDDGFGNGYDAVLVSKNF